MNSIHPNQFNLPAASHNASDSAVGYLATRAPLAENGELSGSQDSTGVPFWARSRAAKASRAVKAPAAAMRFGVDGPRRWTVASSKVCKGKEPEGHFLSLQSFSVHLSHGAVVSTSWLAPSPHLRQCSLGSAYQSCTRSWGLNLCHALRIQV